MWNRLQFILTSPRSYRWKGKAFELKENPFSWVRGPARSASARLWSHLLPDLLSLIRLSHVSFPLFCEDSPISGLHSCFASSLLLSDENMAALTFPGAAPPHAFLHNLAGPTNRTPSSIFITFPHVPFLLLFFVSQLCHPLLPLKGELHGSQDLVLPITASLVPKTIPGT